ncbi:TPA: acyl-CoA reductase [Providencia alcalifaciens]
MYFIYGKYYPSFNPEQSLNILTDMLPITLGQPLPLDALLACTERFITRLEERSFLPQVDEILRKEIRQLCHPQALRFKLEHELGNDPFSLRRFHLSQPQFESWRPLGVVLHITPANATLLPFLAIIESLLVGNINWLRTSTSEQGVTFTLLQAFIECDETHTLANYIAILPVAINSLPLLMKHVNGVSAWGGDNTLTTIRNQLSPNCRWIPWGHRISFAWITQNTINDKQLDELADEVCRFNQQACSSPQIIFVDTESLPALIKIGHRLAQAMHRRCHHWLFQQPDAKSAADITATNAFNELDRVFTDAQNRCWKGENWRIWLKNTVELEPSPLYRTLLLRPLPRHKLIETLRPWRAYLQTCALIATTNETANLSQLLLTAGVNRITTPASMHSGYNGEPHDGVFALNQLVRRVSVTLDAKNLSGLATLNLPPQAPSLLIEQPIMDKSLFTENAIQPSAKLFFRSGGSCGTPKLSGFTYRDYHLQMQAAADGMYAAGLDPVNDKVLNLMYSGNLYGGLLSFFTILDKADVIHLPMGGPKNTNYDEIVKMIESQQVNTLLGMPSTLSLLFQQQESRLRRYGGIRKLLTGGESMSHAQREFLHSFNIEIIRSALYGSIDAGTLGHSCKASRDGVFHLMADIQWLEIVEIQNDTPVKFGEIGRLIFTSRNREGHRVIRYDIGDLGRWVKGPCACGALTPRFELLGRHDNLTRIGTAFIPMQQLALLAETPVQFILDHNPHSRSERIRILTDGDATEVKKRVKNYPLLLMILDAALLEIEVISRPLIEFERHPHSGKTPLVIDKR